jgi:hypothetical protein
MGESHVWILDIKESTNVCHIWKFKGVIKKYDWCLVSYRRIGLRNIDALQHGVKNLSFFLKIYFYIFSFK